MSSYVPLASKIFGCRNLGVQIRVRLGYALIVSKLVYNVHVWSRFEGPAMIALNSVYIRLWRRIAGCPKTKGVTHSDEQVRSMLSIPSLDCFVRRRRLQYVSRMLRSEFKLLKALLLSKDTAGMKLPWVRMLLNDIAVMKAALGTKLANMPDPMDEPAAWCDLACNYPNGWRQLVHTYHDIRTDAVRVGVRLSVADAPGAFARAHCSASFLTPKA